MKKPSKRLTLPAIQLIRPIGGRPAVGAVRAIAQADALPTAKKPSPKYRTKQ